jgi:hypothetical protein
MTADCDLAKSLILYIYRERDKKRKIDPEISWAKKFAPA